MKVSVIIVSYNVKEYLVKCIRSLMKHSDSISFEIIVVDNHSSDGSPDEIQKHFPTCQMISMNGNVGFSEANNRGIKMATGDFIFLLNPDTELKNNALHILVNYLETYMEASVVGPKLFNTDGSLQVSCRKFPGVINILVEALFLHRVLKMDEYRIEKLNSTCEVDFISGAACMFQRELVNKIGYLDPDLFWMEDVDFCYRAKRSGTVIYLPEAEIVHHGSASAKKNYKVSISNQVISKLKYFKKHTNGFLFVCAVVFSLLHVISRLMGLALLYPLRRTWAQKCEAYSYTFKKLLRYLIFREQAINYSS